MANDYDDFAAAYAEDNESNAYNEYYERPHSLALAGDVAGLRVLDAGCGAGAHAAALVARGATLTGVDASAGLLALARDRVPAATFEHADLTDPLPFADDEFDLVMASLLLHYFEDWGPLLREFHRVLRPGGRVVASTHHPTMDYRLAGRTDYLGTYPFTEEWERGGTTVTMRFWHRPLHTMTDAFTAAGFRIDRISEPKPVEAAQTLFPQDFAYLSTNPHFLFFVLGRR